jgi:hypothetical protein
MATTIKLKNGTGAPSAGALVVAEPALDLTNKRLYTEDSGGTVIEVGTNPGVDVTFADNRKAIFGAGSDLQIYHNGNHSFIEDSGTGNLYLRGTNLEIQSTAQEKYLAANANGGVKLYYDNSEKLATTNTGIDVTGTVTADGLTVNSGAENLVATFQSTDTEAQIALVDTTGTSTIRARNDFRFHVNNAATPALKIDSNNDISFYEDTGTTAKLFWDASAESLGIGTSSPNANLEVIGNYRQKALAGNSQGFNLTINNTTDVVDLTNYYNAAMTFGTNNTERMRIDSGGYLIVPNGVTLGTAVGTYAAANTLDDYEEGTWTPALEASTTNPTPTAVTVNNATYTKVGRMVHIQAYITVNLTSIGSGGAQITGLPFTVGAGYAPVLFTHGNLILSSGGYFNNGSTKIIAIENNSTSFIGYAGTGTKALMISGTYEVA